MRRIVILVFALILGGGCSAFRAMFDEDPAVTQQKRERVKQRRETQARSGGDGEVFPSLVPKKQKRDTLYVSSSLTPEERAVLEGTEAASKRTKANDEIEAIRRENREKSEKTSEQVFGGGLKDLV